MLGMLDKKRGNSYNWGTTEDKLNSYSEWWRLRGSVKPRQPLWWKVPTSSDLIEQ